MDTKTLCLGAISMGDQTGYQIKKRFEESFTFFLEVSTSGIYRALNDLEADGAIAIEHVVQRGRPNKKQITLTELGRRQLVSEMLASPARHRVRSDLLFSVLLAHLLPKDHIAAALDRHLEETRAFIPITEEWLAGEGRDAPAGMRFVALFALDVMTAHVAAIERHRPILEEGDVPANVEADERTTPTASKEAADV